MQTIELYPCFLWKLDQGEFETICVSGAGREGRICTGQIPCPEGMEPV